MPILAIAELHHLSQRVMRLVSIWEVVRVEGETISQPYLGDAQPCLSLEECDLDALVVGEKLLVVVHLRKLEHHPFAIYQSAPPVPEVEAANHPQ